MSDLEEIHTLWTEPDMRRHLFDGEAISKVRAEDFLRRSEHDFEERGHGLWGVRRRGSEPLIGFCGLLSVEESGEAELLYGLDRKVWGEGFATEAAKAVIHSGFERAELSRISADADEENTASTKVMERLGMRFEGRGDRGGGTLVHYKIHNEEFLGR